MRANRYADGLGCALLLNATATTSAPVTSRATARIIHGRNSETSSVDEDAEDDDESDVDTGVASGFGAVRKGVKVTVPKLKSFLLSKIDWLIACASVVPHQLKVALMLALAYGAKRMLYSELS